MTVVLHRCRMRTNWMCACGRVARELHQRGIEVDEQRVPWKRSAREEVRELTGQTRVPLLVIDGEAICDSHRIVEHLRWRATRGRTAPMGEER